MRFFKFFVLLCVVITSSRCYCQDVPAVSNAPSGEYFIQDGRYVVLSGSFGSEIHYFLFGSHSQAVAADAYIRSNHYWGEAALVNSGFKGVLPIRTGGSGLVSWAVVDCSYYEPFPSESQSYSAELWDDCEGLLNRGGFDYISVSRSGDWGEVVEYSDDDPSGGDEGGNEGDGSDEEEPELPPDPSNDYIGDCDESFIPAYDFSAVVFYGNERFYISSETDMYSGPQQIVEILRGDAFYASNEVELNQILSCFAPFLSQYSGDTSYILSDPIVVKGYRFFNGRYTGGYVYRIFVTDMAENGNRTITHDPYIMYQLYLYMSERNCFPSGGLGLNASSVFFPSGGALDTGLNGRSSLAGVQLASGSDSGDLTLENVSKHIVFKQNVASDIGAESGDYTPKNATVTSVATASESGTNVYITNNTEVTTDLELGDAPAGATYSSADPSSREVASSDDLLTEEAPTLVYIKHTESTESEWSIDYEKLWADVSELFNAKFNTDAISELGSSSFSSGITPSVYQWEDPFIHEQWTFTIDWNYISSFPLFGLIRPVLSFVLYFSTFIGCVRLFA